MRQRLGKKKLRRLSEFCGVQFSQGLVRGNNGHLKRLYDAKGLAYELYPDCQVWFLEDPWGVVKQLEGKP